MDINKEVHRLNHYCWPSDHQKDHQPQQEGYVAQQREELKRNETLRYLVELPN